MEHNDIKHGDCVTYRGGEPMTVVSLPYVFDGRLCVTCRSGGKKSQYQYGMYAVTALERVKEETVCKKE